MAKAVNWHSNQKTKRAHEAALTHAHNTEMRKWVLLLYLNRFSFVYIPSFVFFFSVLFHIQKYLHPPTPLFLSLSPALFFFWFLLVASLNRSAQLQSNKIRFHMHQISSWLMYFFIFCNVFFAVVVSLYIYVNTNISIRLSAVFSFTRNICRIFCRFNIPLLLSVSFYFILLLLLYFGIVVNTINLSCVLCVCANERIEQVTTKLKRELFLFCQAIIFFFVLNLCVVRFVIVFLSYISFFTRFLSDFCFIFLPLLLSFMWGTLFLLGYSMSVYYLAVGGRYEVIKGEKGFSYARAAAAAAFFIFFSFLENCRLDAKITLLRCVAFARSLFCAAITVLAMDNNFFFW